MGDMMVENKKQKILWITDAEAFLSVDIEIIPCLIEEFNIDWFVIKKASKMIDCQEKLNHLNNHCSLNIQYITIGERERSLKTVKSYFGLFNKVKSTDYDILYTCLSGSPVFMALLIILSNKKKTVLGIHNVHVPDGGTRPLYNKLNNKIAIRTFKNFQTFSNSQYNLLRKITNDNKRIMMAPLTQPDFGKATVTTDHNIIKFLSFGNIRTYKRIDVLIDAAEKAYNTTQKQFRVIIAGKCENFKPYKDKIVHSELFDLRIERVDSKDIPNLFEEADYFVAPYQDIAQSAAIIVAINYLKPVIASKLPAFEEYIEDGVNGYLFSPASIDELASIFVNILNDNSNYQNLKDGLVETVNKKTSPGAISKIYIKFFTEIITGVE